MSAPAPAAAPRCRSCGAALTRTVLDLGEQPLANSYLTAEQLAAGNEPAYPLHVRVCDDCLLVQVDDVVPAEEIFSDYAYFSSYSDSWVEHARRYAHFAAERLGLGAGSLVVEVASNDGYLLQHFVALGVPVLGIEPAANVADTARAAGIPTETRFFGEQCARDLVARGLRADLIVGNNVLAHVPALNDFVEGLSILLADEGVITIEVPHLLELVRHVEFDTIYHEHFSYYSVLALQPLFARHGLRLFDLEQLPTHGGSLRLWVAHNGSSHATTPNVERIRNLELDAKLDRPEGYAGFADRVARVIEGMRTFVAEQRDAGRLVAAYGAAAKGNTLLNACGITSDDIAFVVDRNPNKQDHYLPGSHLPILGPEAVAERRPDFLVILPWNLRDEIVEQMSEIRTWNGRFVVPIPDVTVLD
ncbi:MAG TPA: class I SAM-dependent methyltransferase [Acidimicrobiia bacterium]|nr:class I SAM-dependent methyltransferase [Acidimicrobiia bacterium]